MGDTEVNVVAADELFIFRGSFNLDAELALPPLDILGFEAKVQFHGVESFLFRVVFDAIV